MVYDKKNGDEVKIEVDYESGIIDEENLSSFEDEKENFVEGN